jgi:competence protein ComEC
MNQKLLFISLFGFTGGVVLRSFFSTAGWLASGGNFGFSFTIFVFFLSFIFIFIWFLQRRKRVIFIALALFCVAFGMLRFDIADMTHGNPVLDNLFGKIARVEAIIIDEPDERENKTYLTVVFKNIFIEGKVININSRALLAVDRYPLWEYGDKVILEGKLAKPKNFKNKKTEKEFDYVSYLWKDDIFYQMFYPKIKLVSKGEGNIIKSALFSFKRAFLERVSVVIPEPHASLLGGLVVGAKQSLGEKLLDDFRATGIIHIVVLSGYNVTIIAEAIMRFFAFLPKIFSLWVGAGSIILFAVMVGVGATIVRASIMALLVILARVTGRTSEITRALFIAGFLMVLQNPKILIFDISFQLSFLATLGLIFLPPILEKRFHFVPRKFQMREFALATVATQIFVLPFLLYKMGTLSIVALPVNLLVLIFVPLTMLLGFLTGMIAFLSVILSLPFAFLTYGLLSYELKIVEWFSEFPFVSVQINNFPLWLMFGMYGLYGWVIYKFWNKN